MHVLNPLVRRRSWLLALATLTALLALAAVALAQQARAQTATDLALAVSIAGESDNIVPANGQTISVNLRASSSSETFTDVFIYDLVLRVSGSLEWDVNGRSSLIAAEDMTLPENGRYTNVAGGNALELVDTATGTPPANEVVCSSRVLDLETTWSCNLTPKLMGTWVAGSPPTTTALDTSITVPRGTPDGQKFTISVSAKIRTGNTDATSDRTLSHQIEATVGDVDEVVKATLTPASYRPDAQKSDTTAYKTTIVHNEPDQDGETRAPALTSALTGETALRLSILNEGDRPSAGGSIASILVTTSLGSVRSGVLDGAAPVNYQDGCVGSTTEQLACQIPTGATVLNALNSGNIMIFVKHAGRDKSGKAEVRATVLSKAGTNLTTETVEVTFAGVLDSLELSEPTSGVLNKGTSATGDNRDQLTLVLSAKDKSGNTIAVPSGAYRTTVKGPDSKTVSSGFTICAPLRDNCGSEPTSGPSGANNPTPGKDPNTTQVRLTVNRADNDKLASGKYTLEVTAGSKKAVQEFTVSGDVKTVEVSEPEGELVINGTVSVTATVSDEEGNPVPDGTVISFSSGEAGTIPVLVLRNSDSKTKGGKAEASFLVVSAGSGWIQAGSGGQRGIEPINIPSAAAAPTNPADSLSITTPNTFATWGSETSSTAREVLAGLSGVSQLLLWQNAQWLRYGVVDGQEIPGSYNFEINRASILWLGR